MSAEAVEVAGAERRRKFRFPAMARTDSEFDLRNTWQIAAGAILMPLGLIVILWAWYGAAHANHPQQQIPYMVSGGFIGLGLMIVGGLMFWAHWLYRIYDQADLQHRELLDAINRLAGVESDVHRQCAGEIWCRRTASCHRERHHLPPARLQLSWRAAKACERSASAHAAKLQPCRICEPLVHT